MEYLPLMGMQEIAMAKETTEQRLQGGSLSGPRTTDDEPRTTDVVALIGPTGVGKTSVSISLAQELSAEILSVDSRQIYREITIGTAKPSPEQLKAVPHHFIGERSISDPLTAGKFAEKAHLRIDNILSRGRRVLLVGGSTLYLHALLFGLDDVPPPDLEVRRDLERRLENDGLPALVEEFSRVDPVAYGRTDLSNPRRVIRALEVFESTGRPLSAFQSGVNIDLEMPCFVLNRDRSDLYRRIDDRVDAMIAEGLVEELKVLLEAGFGPDVQALQSIGYKEIIQFLSNSIDLDRAVELIKRNTRRYAKRQLTWFRRYGGFEWVQVNERDDEASICGRVLMTIGH